MGSFRFFRRIPIIGNFVTLNLSKGGVSVSAGVPGARVTAGTSGSRLTFGIPGTGLFYTHKLRASDWPDDPKESAAREYIAGILACIEAKPVEPRALMIALNRQREFGLTDADFAPEIQAGLNDLRAWLRDECGYRVVRAVPPSPQIEPARSSRTATWVWLIVAALVLLAAVEFWMLRDYPPVN